MAGVARQATIVQLSNKWRKTTSAVMCSQTCLGPEAVIQCPFSGSFFPFFASPEHIGLAKPERKRENLYASVERWWRN